MAPRPSAASLFRRAFVRAPQANNRPALLLRSYRVANPESTPASDKRLQLDPQERAQVNKRATLGSLDLFAGVEAPVYSIRSVSENGFGFESGVEVEDGSGVFLWQNQCFKWRPAERSSEVEAKALKTGVLELDDDVWGMLDVLHPRPELLIVGTGATAYMLSPKDRERLTGLGITMESMDTNNAATYYNLLAQERPLQVAAAMMVYGFGARKQK